MSLKRNKDRVIKLFFKINSNWKMILYQFYQSLIILYPFPDEICPYEEAGAIVVSMTLATSRNDMISD